MKKSYRVNQENIYISALVGVGVKATAEALTVHRDASCTVVGVSEKILTRIMGIQGVEVIRTGAMEATILIPAASEYAAKNSPFITQAEKDAQEAAKAARAANRVVKNKPELELEEEEEDDSEE